jgi:hypothetical protein
VGVAEIMKWTGYSRQGAYNTIERLIDLKMLESFGDTSYSQKYIYADYYGLFDEEFVKKRDAK